MKNDPVRSVRILLVDDNQHGLTARQLILSEIGYSVDTALSGEAAWDVFQQNPYDIVVTDFRMGGMDGVQLIGLIRNAFPATRIVLLSGFAGCLGMTEQSTGADEVLMKSNREAPELVRAIRRLVSQGPRRKPTGSESGSKIARRSAGGAAV